MNEENFYILIGLLSFCIGTVIIHVLLKLKYRNEIESLKNFKKK